MARRPDDRPRPSRLRRALRLLGGLGLGALFAAVLAGGFLYHRARAQLTDTLYDLGARMMFYAEAERQSAPRDVVVNGQTFRLSTGVAARSLDEVLDHFEARCAEVDEDIGRGLEGAGPIDRSEIPSPRIRSQSSSDGFVACLDLGAEEVGFAELSARLARFEASGDVSEIGQMRYVFADERRGEAGPSTHFVAMWTHGRFNVRAMFPDEGDAPGRDVPGLARPPASRRVLTGFERDQPHTLTVYSSSRSEAELERFYRGALHDAGFVLLERPEHRTAEGALPTLFAERGERMLTVVLRTDPEQVGAQAAVFDLR